MNSKLTHVPPPKESQAKLIPSKPFAKQETQVKRIVQPKQTNQIPKPTTPEEKSTSTTIQENQAEPQHQRWFTRS